jgi:hypothetical protein
MGFGNHMVLKLKSLKLPLGRYQKQLMPILISYILSFAYYEAAHEKTHKDTDNFLVTVGDRTG